jgi:hypothetical protein
MIVLISESEGAAFLEDAAELWRRREAHGSIRIQEGEPFLLGEKVLQFGGDVATPCVIYFIPPMPPIPPKLPTPETAVWPLGNTRTFGGSG